MRRIALDTIGPLEISNQFRVRVCHQFTYILVIIDEFNSYVELFLKDVTAEAATECIMAKLMYLWHHRNYDGCGS